MRKRLDPHTILFFSLSIVYIIFGVLKVIDRSPVKEMVTTAMPLMANTWLFALLGVGEVVLGIGLLIKQVRRYAALGIILHLLSVLLITLLRPDILFSAVTGLTWQGEFVLKNAVLAAAAWAIYHTGTRS